MIGFDLKGGHLQVLQVTRRRFFQLGGAAFVAQDLLALDAAKAGIEPKVAEAVAGLQYLIKFCLQNRETSSISNEDRPRFPG